MLRTASFRLVSLVFLVALAHSATDPRGSLASTPAPLNTTAIQCCRMVDGGTATCQVKTPKSCQNSGGISRGPGTCNPNPCGSATTTTTSSTSSSTTTSS